MYCLMHASSTDDPALVPPICAVMRTGSLKTLCVIGLHSQLAEQVLKELPHCTQLRELELELNFNMFRLDKVRHVTLYPIHQQSEQAWPLAALAPRCVAQWTTQAIHHHLGDCSWVTLPVYSADLICTDIGHCHSLACI